MAGSVINDPESLRDFARDLHGMQARVADEMSGIRNALNNLGESWQDQHYHHFRDVFDASAAQIQRFLDEAERYRAHLNGLAAPLEEYHERARRY